ncbi:hypothetical protein ACLOJK_034247, partial [Asimina triloba]
MAIDGFQNPMDDMLFDAWEEARFDDCFGGVLLPTGEGSCTNCWSAIHRWRPGWLLPLPLVMGLDSSPARLIGAFFIDVSHIWGEDVDTVRLDGSDRPIGPSPELSQTAVLWRRWSTRTQCSDGVPTT